MTDRGTPAPQPSSVPAPAPAPDGPGPLAAPVPAPWPQRVRLAWASVSSSLPLSRTAMALGGTAVALVALVVGFLLWQGRPGPLPELVLPRAVPGSGALPATGAPGSPGVAGTTSSTTTSGGGAGAMATVHAAGAVAHPGIYVVPAGGRVADVLTAAGGAVAEADLDRVNLATRVSDGDRVYVPRRGEEVPAVVGGPAAPGGGDTSVSSGPRVPTAEAPLDLNLADEAQLDLLPGVGPATAHAIVGYRQRNGRFRTVDELIDVPGIGPSKLDTMRPLVRV